MTEDSRTSARRGRNAPRRRAGRAAAPADGERTAVGGYGHQYMVAAFAILDMAAELRAVRLADPAAGGSDDFAVVTQDSIHAVQVKWPEYPGSTTLAALCKVDDNGRGPVRDLADGWVRLFERESRDGAGLQVHVRLVTRDFPSRNPEPLLEGCDGGKHAAAFFAHGLGPAQEALLAGAERPPTDLLKNWSAAFMALRDASGLEEDAFWKFLPFVHFMFGAVAEVGSLVNVARRPEIERDAAVLAKHLFGLVAGIEPGQSNQIVEVQARDLWTALGWTHRPGLGSLHQFPVPQSYVPNTRVAAALATAIEAHTRGYVLLEGTPGSGKSTLLSAAPLPATRVVRYYSYVPDAPTGGISRGDASAFLAEICEQLAAGGARTAPAGRDVAALQMRLAEALDVCGRQFRTDGHRTIIVVDGLDHILREQAPVQPLLSVLPSMEDIPDGVLFVLGSQTGDVLPAAIRSHIRGPRVVHMEPLDGGQVLSIADRAGVGALLTPRQRKRLVAAAEGHPLAATYLVNSLALAHPPFSPVCVVDPLDRGEQVVVRVDGHRLDQGALSCRLDQV